MLLYTPNDTQDHFLNAGFSWWTIGNSKIIKSRVLAGGPIELAA